MFESKVILTRKEYDDLNAEIYKLKKEKEEIKKEIFSKCFSFNSETVNCHLNWDDVVKMFGEEATQVGEEIIKKSREVFCKNV